MHAWSVKIGGHLPTTPDGRPNGATCHRFDDPTVSHDAILAEANHPPEFTAQHAKLCNLALDGCELGLGEPRDPGARSLRLFLKPDQCPDGREIKP